MGIVDWLRRVDRRNQAISDALVGRLPVDGVGVVIESLASDRNSHAGGYRNRVSIDGAPSIPLRFGTTFHALAPGAHVLRFSTVARTMRASATVVVPEGGRARVRYQPAVWFGRAATLEVLEA